MLANCRVDKNLFEDTANHFIKFKTTVKNETKMLCKMSKSSPKFQSFK